MQIYLVYPELLIKLETLEEQANRIVTTIVDICFYHISPIDSSISLWCKITTILFLLFSWGLSCCSSMYIFCLYFQVVYTLYLCLNLPSLLHLSNSYPQWKSRLHSPASLPIWIYIDLLLSFSLTPIMVAIT